MIKYWKIKIYCRTSLKCQNQIDSRNVLEECLFFTESFCLYLNLNITKYNTVNDNIAFINGCMHIFRQSQQLHNGQKKKNGYTSCRLAYKI